MVFFNILGQFLVIFVVCGYFGLLWDVFVECGLLGLFFLRIVVVCGVGRQRQKQKFVFWKSTAAFLEIETFPSAPAYGP